MFSDLQPLSLLAGEIRRCIISEDEISDDASPGLRQVRRSIKLTNDRIRTALSSMVNGSSRTYLQDAVITQRNGRFCIPVKAEYRSQVPGMIHDQSSTGSTLFVEPMSVVKLNNDLRELEIREEKRNRDRAGRPQRRSLCSYRRADRQCTAADGAGFYLCPRAAFPVIQRLRTGFQ
jgi:DNA mismatch repair protein MutS2